MGQKSSVKGHQERFSVIKYKCRKAIAYERSTNLVFISNFPESQSFYHCRKNFPTFNLTKMRTQ